ncbi:hypothetical protein [Neobacillus sp. DY30]|uniref:hypothetical protein n=1 Tax=Neobacillus sp. DY30 TaxID=3047871 RepID=UPI0024BF6DF5|nr:hypothetical protein [Neobacillus sp. DY30]WHY02532.1 hypothetical protein QNH29_10020 [Neobacillus sp. DY30]
MNVKFLGGITPLVSVNVAENVEKSSLSTQASTFIVRFPLLVTLSAKVILIVPIVEVIGVERTPQEHLIPIVTHP